MSEPDGVPEQTSEPDGATETPNESSNVDVMKLLKESLAVKGELEAARKEIAELKAAKDSLERAQLEARRTTAVREAGLPEECAQFLSLDDADGWESAIKALQGVAAATKPTRDPAAEAPLASDDGEKYVRKFLGLR